MRLGDLLVGSKLVTEDGIKRAVEHQTAHGGKLGECLVTTGAVEQSRLNEFLDRIPPEPANMEATGVDRLELMGLLMKLIYAGRMESVREFSQAIRLPYLIASELVQMAVDRKLLMAVGAREAGNLGAIGYQLTEEGRRWTVDLLSKTGYTGPAPVTLEDFVRQVGKQKPTSETITYDRIRKATEGLTFEDDIVEQCGPALNSGRATLLYGVPGNGKTSMALSLASIFDDVIYVPYAIQVDDQTIRVYDPSIHKAIEPAKANGDDPLSLVRQEVFDGRWVACKRPFVIAGGELTLDMLDLRYDAMEHSYEAPLHVKALCGCFVIDDFGHQLISPTNLLNRWIVPLENRVDYLKLHTGKTFTVPFEELIIFSTNLEPADLMDAAFLRRVPYKIQVGAPTLESYWEIFKKECAKQEIELSRDVFEGIVYALKSDKGVELARYQPKFIVDQVVASCRFMQQPKKFEPRFVMRALDNLYVNHLPKDVPAKAGKGREQGKEKETIRAQGAEARRDRTAMRETEELGVERV